MKIISIIPARYNSERFPGKLLSKLGKETVLEKTYKSVLNTSLFNRVIVATDSKIIYDKISSFGGETVYTKGKHSCGSDRVAEVAKDLDVDIIVNVQADEPFIDKISLKKVINIFVEDIEEEIGMVSLMTPINDLIDVNNRNIVKVVVDSQNFALYFSRSPIPFNRDNDSGVQHYRHIGVYGFRKKTLIEFAGNSMTPLEEAEKIECIRQLENGKKIKMVETKLLNVSIDTNEDISKAEQLLD